jgi:hypothetical protein
MGSLSGRGLNGMVTTSYNKTICMLQNVTQLQTWIYSLVHLKHWKRDMIFGTWLNKVLEC